ncbi:MAG: threonine synthase [Alphaproteobacteria bacterium]|nr:threonine synthase [Alphaproteobacteria bacterium]MBV9694729.1 threonine synthase [Alphaproteobacteria bacterium]
MKFVSTRGLAPAVGFRDVLLSGLAQDGGLYMPDAWPHFDADVIAAFADKSYAHVAFEVLQRFGGATESDDALHSDIAEAYAGFDDARIAPLIEITRGQYLLELFHGPTLAFKDIALQLLGRMVARTLKQVGRRLTIVAATSGDTGSAAIAAFGGLPQIEIFVLHPHGRISAVQRRQMTTSSHANVHNIALEGTFDDAQALVKALFADRDFAERAKLGAVNSINFARIAAQTVYYFTAAAHLGVPATFIVPTGNFGDIFAGEGAMRMGLPIRGLMAATNANDIVARALEEGIYAAGPVQATLSPSMDIQVASNFERALFEAGGRDSAFVRDAMAAFARERRLVLPEPVRIALSGLYRAVAIDDAATLQEMAATFAQSGRLVDPHTAVALAAARRSALPGPLVVLSTAHPAKFPDAVRRATGQIPALPPRLSGLLAADEKFDVLKPDLGLVRDFIAARVPPS